MLGSMLATLGLDADGEKKAVVAPKSTGKGKVHSVNDDTSNGRRDTSQCKTTIAAAVFAECYAMEKIPQRKDIIAKVRETVGPDNMSENCAATYLQNWKKANGHTKS